MWPTRGNGGLDRQALRAMRLSACFMALQAVLLATHVAASVGAPSVIATDAGHAWFTEIVDQGVFVSGSTAIAIDSGDRAHIAFVDSDTGRVTYARRTGEGWGIETPLGVGEADGMISMGLGPDDSVHLSYIDRANGFVNYARESDSGWSVIAIEKSHVEGYTSLAIDPGGLPQVAYVGGNGVVRHARWNGTAWTMETVDRDVVTARYPSLAVDSSGVPSVAYYANGMLRHARWNGFRWSVETVDAEASAQFVTLVLDSANLPQIAYRDSAQQELRFASWDGVAWATEVIDTVGDVGWDARLALDREGIPHVSYYDVSLGRLKHAAKSGGSWQAQVVDVAYLAGWYSNLALDRSSRPHISYFSWPDRVVKHAIGDFGLGIRTWPATGVTHEAATLNGEMTSLGNATEAEVFFEWRPSGGNWSRTSRETLVMPGFVSLRIDGLAAETRYEFRATAFAAEASWYGDRVVFLTPKVPPPTSIHPGVVVGAFVAAGVGVAVLVHLRTKPKNQPERIRTAPGKKESRP